MVIQFRILVVPLVLLIDGTFCRLFDLTMDSTYLQETNILQLKNEGNQEFTNPVVLYNPRFYSKINKTGKVVETNGNQIAEEDGSKIQENAKTFQSKLSGIEDRVFGSGLLLLGTLSILGNSCIFILFYSQTKHLSPVELLIVHLAIVDVLTTIASYPLPIMTAFKLGWRFGEIECNRYAVITESLRGASVISITLIALFQCLKTCTFSLGLRITCWTSYKMLAWGNILSFLWAVTPLVGIGKYDVEPFGLECGVYWIAKDLASQSRVVLEAIFGVLFPLVIILICYFQIIKTVIGPTVQLQNTHFRRRNGKVMASQLMFIATLVVFGFAITRIPITVVMLLSSFRGELTISTCTTLIPVLLSKSSAALHPFIYVMSTKRYRRTLFRIMKKWLNLKSGNETQYYVKFNRSHFSNDMKSIFERDMNGNVIVEMYINSSGKYEICQWRRTFEYRNGEGCYS